MPRWVALVIIQTGSMCAGLAGAVFVAGTLSIVGSSFVTQLLVAGAAGTYLEYAYRCRWMRVLE